MGTQVTKTKLDIQIVTKGLNISIIPRISTRKAFSHSITVFCCISLAAGAGEVTNLYSVSYNTNNSTGGTTPATQTAESKATTYTFTAPSPEKYGLIKTNYAFGGWTEDPKATTPQYIPNQTITLTSSKPSITLYAIWVSPTTPARDWQLLYYMQQMNPTVCANATETGKQLIDVRDGKKYWVAKLADENCWMTQNLDLNLNAETPLSPENSDVATNWNPDETTIASDDLSINTWPNNKNGGIDGYDIIRSYDPGEKIAYGNTLLDVKNNTDSHLLVGNYYSWNAATAGSGVSTTDSKDAGQSICPKGWRLPSNNSSTTIPKGPTYNGLINAYQISSNQDGIKALQVAPLYVIAAGYIVGGALYIGNQGHYWNATAHNTTNGYSLQFDNSRLYLSSGGTRYEGRSVRCVAR